MTDTTQVAPVETGDDDEALFDAAMAGETHSPSSDETAPVDVAPVPATDTTPAQDASPEPEAPPQGAAPAPEAPPAPAPPQERQPHLVPVDVVVEERRRRQQAEERLRAFEEAQRQPPPDFFASPEEAVARQQLPLAQETDRLAVTVDALRKGKGVDYVETAMRAFDQAVNEGRIDPREAARIMASPRPFSTALQWYQELPEQREAAIVEKLKVQGWSPPQSASPQSPAPAQAPAHVVRLPSSSPQATAPRAAPPSVSAMGAAGTASAKADPWANISDDEAFDLAMKR